MVMLGRTDTMAPSSGHASPGPQVLTKNERPIPALRRGAQPSYPQELEKPLHRDDNYSFSHMRAGFMPPTSSNPNNTINDDRRRMVVTPTVTSYRGAVLPGRPVSTVRPQSAMALTSPGHPPVERPPSSLGVAWGSSHRYNSNRNGADNRTTEPSGSLEDRLKSLMADGMDRTRAGRKTPTNQQMYDEGQLILPVHQKSRSYGDGVTMGPGYNGMDGPYQDGTDDVYAVVSKRPDLRQGHAMLPGFVPPQTSERRGSVRTDLPAKSGYSAEPMTSVSGSETPMGGPRGQENPAFIADDIRRSRESLSKNTTSGSFDLRSAWQRLYGNQSEPPSNRRSSAGDQLMARSQTQQNTHLQSPHYPRPNHARLNSSSDDMAEAANSFHNHSSASMLAYNPHQQLNSSHDHTFANPSLMVNRESPTGQSSSNPEQVSGSNNSSQLSAYAAPVQRNLTSTFKPKIGGSSSSINKSSSNNNSNNSSNQDPALGPAAKYPEPQLSKRVSNTAPRKTSSPFQNARNLQHDAKPFGSSSASPQYAPEPSVAIRPGRESFASDMTVEFNVADSSPPRPLSRGPGHKQSTLYDTGDESESPPLNPADSIFDYPDAESDNESVTPPLPPLSPGATPREAGSSTPTNASQGFSFSSSNKPHHRPKSPPKTPDLLRKMTGPGGSWTQGSRKDGAPSRHSTAGRSHGVGAVKEERRHNSSGHAHGEGAISKAAGGSQYARSRSLEDVRESENESMLSFDVENTLLLVEPSDQSEMGTLRSHKSGGSVRAQLHRLEGMYSHVMKTLEENSQAPRTRRRWSIGSSDTSSFHQHSHQGKHSHSRTASQKMSSRDVRSIGKRFQRLESHVITLARSVAHLSSELRSQNSMSREIENVKREMNELKSQGPANHAIRPKSDMGGNVLMTDYERYRGWVPSLTNPRRVNKLTKFFGQEPPLLQIFLKRLGYERFAKNFEDEHIGMIELPYMTEERLQSIGIPMGPRLRILQEAQLCFQQGNFDIYFV
ncbi:filaggrin-2 [Aplysia californica]|uniref:Filaggrin-2 n=1 Tax=Aplysia californica TaxID=6500 RepID=A0ABM1A028_APLCA|nr:filaggrin-2 [Aplysia californica]